MGQGEINESIHGSIVSDWKRESRQFVLDVAIPAGITATVYLPTNTPEVIMESGRPLDQVPEVRLLRVEGEQAVLGVSSGKYSFAVGH